MTVGELIRLLSTQPVDREVVLSCDGEGNAYSKAFHGKGNMLYFEAAVYDDEEGLRDIEGVTADKAEQVFVLWPTG